MADNVTNVPEEMAGGPVDDGMPSSYAGGSRKNKSSGTTKFIMTVGGAFAVIIGAVVWSVSNEINDTRLARPSAIDSTPGGRIQAGSDLYQERLVQFNEARADQATQLGVTYVPTPDMILQPLGNDDLLFRPGSRVDVTSEPDYQLFNVESRVDWTPGDPVVFEAPPSMGLLNEAVLRNNLTVGRSSFGSGGQGTGPAGGQSSGRNVNTNSSADEEEPENPYIQAITRQMGAAANTYPPAASSLFGSAAPRETEVSNPDGATLPDLSDGDQPAAVMETIFQPGDILYGETLNYVTSDLSTPVLVRLTTGPYAGARLIGAFEVDNASSKLFIGFSTITFENGETVPVEAFAVDGYTSAATVSSSVNNRYLARYGAVMASAFVAGFADSAAKTGESVVSSRDSTIVAGGAATTEQSLYAGLAAAGTVIAGDIADRAPKGPEIIIRGGYPIGILIVAPVTIETEPQID